MDNKNIINSLLEIANLLDIKGDKQFRIGAYRRAVDSLQNFSGNIREIFKKQGVKGIQKIPGIGKSIGEKIAERVKTGKIKYLQELKEETTIRQIVTHYFETKGVDLTQLKRDARKRKIVYARYTKPAKQLLELAGSVRAGKKAIDIVAAWAQSRNLDYAIETVFKKWLELDRLKPKDVVKKPYYLDDPMLWSETKKKWYVVSKEGEWLEYADSEDKIEWRIID